MLAKSALKKIQHFENQRVVIVDCTRSGTVNYCFS